MKPGIQELYNLATWAYGNWKTCTCHSMYLCCRKAEVSGASRKQISRISFCKFKFP